MEKELKEWLEFYEELSKELEQDIELFNEEGLKEQSIFMKGRKTQVGYVIMKLKDLLKIQ